MFVGRGTRQGTRTSEMQRGVFNSEIGSTDEYGNPLEDEALLAEREKRTFHAGRSNYHGFLEKIQGNTLDNPVSADAMREYLLKQLLYLSGSPDQKVALKAIETLAKVRGIDLFGEMRRAPVQDDGMDELAEALRKTFT